ncbi:MAG: hypothetical protein J6K43_03955 [Lachnospiraceae bacterium]|nr:hypothetical protein [Lachnospiraceae bacterium]
MKKQEGKVRLVIEYAILVLIIGILLFWILNLSQLHISKFPISYSNGDGITGLVTMKSMQDTGWIYENPYMGAPYGVKNYDATTMELFLNLIQQILVWITGNWILAYNLFYLLGYFLCGITSFYVLKRLSVSGLVSIPLAVLYTFAPYHLGRGTGHLYLGMYFMVPLMCLYLFRLWKEDTIFVKGQNGWITKKNILCLVTLMIMALTGIYYAFFMCFFLCVIILYSLLNDRNKKRIIQSICSIGIIVTTLLVGSIPNTIYWINNGGSVIPDKGANGAELYGLKIIQLLLPISNHRIPILAELRQKYDAYYPLVTENSLACLGLVTAVGFVIICVCLFIGKRLPEKSNLRIASLLTLAAILFGTIGGFSSALSFVMSSIRCYNRFSIFIAMFSLITLGTLLQKLVDKCQGNQWKKVFMYSGMVVLLVLGILDQTLPVSGSLYADIENQYQQDDEFIKEIEAMAGEEAMIYQMPYMQNPENGAINQMQDYAHYMGYIHSDSLRWSYGSIIGRDADNFCRSINELPLDEQIVQIEAAGYSGIYIDWNAYLPDEREAMELVLGDAIEGNCIRHSNGMKVYYNFY